MNINELYAVENFNKNNQDNVCNGKSIKGNQCIEISIELRKDDMNGMG